MSEMITLNPSAGGALRRGRRPLAASCDGLLDQIVVQLADGDLRLVARSRGTTVRQIRQMRAHTDTNSVFNVLHAAWVWPSIPHGGAAGWAIIPSAHARMWARF